MKHFKKILRKLYSLGTRISHATQKIELATEKLLGVLNIVTEELTRLTKIKTDYFNTPEIDVSHKSYIEMYKKLHESTTPNISVFDFYDNTKETFHSSCNPVSNETHEKIKALYGDVDLDQAIKGNLAEKVKKAYSNEKVKEEIKAISKDVTKMFAKGVAEKYHEIVKEEKAETDTLCNKILADLKGIDTATNIEITGETIQYSTTESVKFLTEEELKAFSPSQIRSAICCRINRELPELTSTELKDLIFSSIDKLLSKVTTTYGSEMIPGDAVPTYGSEIVPGKVVFTYGDEILVKVDETNEEFQNRVAKEHLFDVLTPTKRGYIKLLVKEQKTKEQETLSSKHYSENKGPSVAIPLSPKYYSENKGCSVEIKEKCDEYADSDLVYCTGDEVVFGQHKKYVNLDLFTLSKSLNTLFKFYESYLNCKVEVYCVFSQGTLTQDTYLDSMKLKFLILFSMRFGGEWEYNTSEVILSHNYCTSHTYLDIINLFKRSMRWCTGKLIVKEEEKTLVEMLKAKERGSK